MVLTTINGSKVYFVDNDKKCLIDNGGVKWKRDPKMDRDGRAAYTETKANISTVLLTVQDLVRATKGVAHMTTPITVEEMRYYSTRLPGRMHKVIDQWPDQKLREILCDAEEQGKHPGHMMELAAQKEMEPEVQPTKEPGMPTGASPLTSVKPRPQGTSSNTPRRRKQEGSISVALDGMSILLTPKQLEFMERLSENPGWKKDGPNGTYIMSAYMNELEDTMSPISAGAVLTTLREKKILTTEKVRYDGYKTCSFKLTELGIQVYKKLSGGNKNG